MTFKHDFVQRKSIVRNDSPTGRTYSINDNLSDMPVYRSVTSILKDSLDNSYLDKWIQKVGVEKAEMIKISAGLRGTDLHSTVESYLLNDQGYLKDSMPLTKSSFLNIKPFLDENIGTIRGIELPVYSHVLKAAGTADLFAEWKRKPAIIDFKTSSKPKKKEYIFTYFLQTTAYAIMIEELYGVKVEDIVIVMAVDFDRPILFEEKTDNYRNDVYQIFKGM